MLEDHRESEDEVEYVVDGETGEVAISGGFHGLARQYDDVDDVTDTAEREDRWNEQLEGDRLDDIEDRSAFRQSRVLGVSFVVVELQVVLVFTRRVPHGRRPSS